MRDRCRRTDLGDPANLIDQKRQRDRAKAERAGWRGTVWRQQNPEPVRDRYSAMAERLLGRRST